MTILQGKVIQTEGSPQPHSYLIEGDKDGKTYFAHMGDISHNTVLLYELSKNGSVSGQIVALNEGDTVQFEVPEPRYEKVHKVKKI